MKMRPPLFIIGNPRSGTTLLRLMLTNHKNIVIPPESGFAVWFYSKYKSIVFSEANVRNFIEDLGSARKIETWGLDFSELLDYILLKKPNSYPEMIGSVYEFYGRSIGKNFLRWGDKNNYYLNHIYILKKMYQSAYFIHIVRDGRDVACSYRKLHETRIESEYAPNLPYDIKDIALEWSKNIKVIKASLARLTTDNVYEIRYEDLVTQPESELRKVCQFLGEPYDRDMELFFVKNKNEHQEPVEFLQWKAKTIERPTTSEIGKYKFLLSRDEIKIFNEIASPLLQKYGY